MLSYKNFCYGNMFSNGYVIWDEESGEAMIVDCGNPVDRISHFIAEENLTVKYVFLTHAHYDHVLYMDDYRALFTEAKLIIGARDAALLSDVEGNVSYLFGDSRVFAKPDAKLSDGEILKLGDSELISISSPGHTPGCTCLYSAENKLMVTGDVLFGGGGVGRTDFKHGSIEDLRLSLRRLLSMDGDITILPGHGGASKIAYEQRSLLY